MINNKLLIPFLMAGVPSLTETEKIAEAMIKGGAQILELGVPFSDPSADGVVLQKASEVALKNNLTLKDVLQTAANIKEKFPDVGIVIFTYLNPILSFGLRNYVQAAVKAGISATLTVDLPVEEASEYLEIHRQGGLKTVFLASPTTSESRLKKIQEASTGFLYYVSRTGVTGEQQSLSETLSDEMKLIRARTSIPVAVGFGISTPEQVQVVAKVADAVIIGSAYMRMIMAEVDSSKRLVAVGEFTKECIEALRSPTC